MKPYELFQLIKDTKYDTIGDDLDYKIRVVEGRPVLLFQESTSDEDWFNNFDFASKVYKNQKNKMKIHRGYARVWKSGNDKIMNEFVALSNLYDTRPLIAGWSFGGAMCVLAAEDLFFRSGIKCDLVSFGAPKVCGDKATAEYIESCCNACVEYSQYNDCVSLLPPLPGFHHLNPVKLGDRFNLIKVFNPGVYHMDYDDKSLYKE